MDDLDMGKQNFTSLYVNWPTTLYINFNTILYYNYTIYKYSKRN